MREEQEERRTRLVLLFALLVVLLVCGVSHFFSICVYVIDSIDVDPNETHSQSVCFVAVVVQVLMSIDLSNVSLVLHQVC